MMKSSLGCQPPGCPKQDRQGFAAAGLQIPQENWGVQEGLQGFSGSPSSQLVREKGRVAGWVAGGCWDYHS